MQRRALEAKADAIETILGEHKAPAHVTGGHVTPRFVQFLLQPNPGVRVTRIESLSREIAVALGVPEARVTTQGGAVRVEVPRSDPQVLNLFNLCGRIPPARVPFCTAVLGLADDGAPLLMRLPSPEVSHVLIAGVPGSGKTTLLQTLVLSLALLNHRRQVQFVLIDSRGDSFTQLARLPHLLRPIVTDAQAARDELSRLVTLREQRELGRITDPRVVVVIDDLDALYHRDLAHLLDELVRYGSGAGLHFLIASAKLPTEPLLQTIIPVRLIGHLASAEEARVIAGVGGTGADKLTGPGDFVAVYGPGLIRFQAACLPDRGYESASEKLAEGFRGDEVVAANRPNGRGPIYHADGSVTHSDQGKAVFALPGREIELTDKE